MAKRMHMMVWVVAVVVAMAGGASAVSCNTNGASPTQADDNNVVQSIRQLGSTQCCQLNCGGDSCTVMMQSGGAQALICGECNTCTTCAIAGDALNEILAQCVINVGGTARCSGTNNAAGFEFVLDSVGQGIGAPIDIDLKTRV